MDKVIYETIARAKEGSLLPEDEKLGSTPEARALLVLQRLSEQMDNSAPENEMRKVLEVISANNEPESMRTAPLAFVPNYEDSFVT